MRRRKAQPMCNKLDLADAKQVRLVKKRLRLSEAELAQITELFADPNLSETAGAGRRAPIPGAVFPQESPQ